MEKLSFQRVKNKVFAFFLNFLEKMNYKYKF